MAADLARVTAADLAREIRRKSISPGAAVDAAIAQIERHNDRLRAFCTPTFETARAAARSVEHRLAAGEPVGALAGVPISIKDLIFTRGVRTTGGCVAYSDYVPEEDDVVVQRLKAADAVVLGKTNVSEFGYSLTGDNPLFGVTRNPWDPMRTSGGSSAGAAVGVATGMGPVAIGSDGGGSIRVPAAFCGVYGFKPSMGRVPLYPGCRDERLPGFSSWESLEHIGPLARTVADAALIMSVIAGPHPFDRRSVPNDRPDWHGCLNRDIKGWRIGFCRTWDGIAVDPEIAAAVAEAAQAFRELGCIVEEVTPAWGNPVAQFRALIALESDLPGMRALVTKTDGRMSPHLKKLLAHEWTGDTFSEAIKARKAVSNAMARLMARFDLLLTPTTHGPPPPADKAAGADDFERPLPLFTCIANLTGQPAASLPAGRGGDGLPIGVQIMGRHLGDADVLSASAAFERARPWAACWPDMD